MSDLIASAVHGVARDWRAEAERRRKISKADPAADTLDYCAGEIVARVRDVETAAQMLTVEEYAKESGVTAQTVRTWIRRRQLTAHPGPKGYRIPRGAQRAERVRRAS